MKKKKHLYLISGLGSDERVFQYLDIEDCYKVHYIQWINPMEGESMAQYAQRLLEQVKTPEPVIAGVSMGGMVAVEMGKLIATEKIILISSAKYAAELPGQFSFFGKWKIHRLLPDFLLLQPNTFFYHLFGVSKKRHKVLLRNILRDTDTDFVRWAMDAILDWDNETTAGTVIHIHGSDDRIIPLENVQADYIIPGGTHSMIFQRPEEITGLLKNIIG